MTKANHREHRGKERTRRWLCGIVGLGAAWVGCALLGGIALAQGAGEPQYTLRARVPLTIVDVTVTDAKGRPVRGLKQSDFTVLEDGKEVQPNSFEEHTADDAARSTTVVKETLPPGSFTNAVPAAANASAPLNVLLIDNLNTPTLMQTMVQRLMLDFIAKLPAGTRMEVLVLDPKLRIVQGFTDDRELLKAAVASTRPHFENYEDAGQETEQIPQTLEEQATLAASRAENQLSAMRQIARYLGGMPGRKNLLWFTGSTPTQFPPQPADPNLWPPYVMYDDTEAMKAAGDLLARAHVAVYPVDSRGLEVVKPNTRRWYLLYGEHGTMETFAEETGGKAFYNTNGLTEAAAAAIDAGANFYTITYAPVNQALDTRFRTIKVTVDRPGLSLVYRNGYYAVEPSVDTKGKKIETVTPMQSAMMRGALDATQILFKVSVVQAAKMDAAVPESNKPDAQKMKGPFRHFAVAYTIDVHGIDFAPSPDGNYRGDFEYGVRVFNADGDEIVNTVTKTVSPILPPAVYRSMLAGGAHASQEIDVPATGEYFLRIGVHDLASDRVGSIEVPVSAVAGAPTGKN